MSAPPFAPYYMSIIIRTTLIVLIIYVLLSFVFAHVLTRRIISPIERTANSLRNINRKTNAAEIAFPKELAEIEMTFGEVKKEIAYLYEDFENLSSYISHEQKNSLALLRAMIQNECPAIGERITAQLDRMVKSLDDILTLSANESKLEKVDLSLICGMAADEYKSANNRAYYAIFYTVNAVHALYGNAFKRHKDAIGNFNKDYVRTEIFPREMGRKIGEAEEIRHASDYDDFYIASREESERQITVADEFIQLAERYCMMQFETPQT